MHYAEMDNTQSCESSFDLISFDHDLQDTCVYTCLLVHPPKDRFWFMNQVDHYYNDYNINYKQQMVRLHGWCLHKMDFFKLSLSLNFSLLFQSCDKVKPVSRQESSLCLVKKCMHHWILFVCIENKRETMAIIHSCCCRMTLRQGSFACGTYTFVSSPPAFSFFNFYPSFFWTLHRRKWINVSSDKFRPFFPKVYHTIMLVGATLQVDHIPHSSSNDTTFRYPLVQIVEG